ncbi:hypothetical protein K438DRAFT_1960181 [Mycena galopus ATCC 62051]|nr:hypothetical protein K438DRAFT_1960181 [Mycena galopus ATCC 62051]
MTSQPKALISHLTIPNAAHSVVSAQLSEIWIGSQFFIDWPSCIAILESRWKAEGCTLRLATMALVRDWPHDEDLAKLGSLRREGLALFMLHGDDPIVAMGVWMHNPTWD